MIANVIINCGALTKIIITSKKYGSFICLIDTEDVYKIKSFNWYYDKGHAPKSRKGGKTSN